MKYKINEINTIQVEIIYAYPKRSSVYHFLLKKFFIQIKKEEKNFKIFFLPFF